MAPRETENNAYAKFGVTNKEHCGMLWYFQVWSITRFHVVVVQWTSKPKCTKNRDPRAELLFS